MKKIIINDIEVEISIETYKRIERVAEERKTSFAEAVKICLEKVI